MGAISASLLRSRVTRLSSPWYGARIDAWCHGQVWNLNPEVKSISYRLRGNNGRYIWWGWLSGMTMQSIRRKISPYCRGGQYTW